MKCWSGSDGDSYSQFTLPLVPYGIKAVFPDWFEPRLTGSMGERKLTDIPRAFASADWNSPKINKTGGGEQDISVNGVTLRNPEKSVE